VRKIKQGDKMSSRSGCKAIVSKVLDAVDMPFTEDGIVPDIIFSPHSVPTRMIVGQMYEAVTARLCVENADTFDGTVFCNFDLEYIYQ
jgi:DNA-directed RNA polymerase subunit B